MRKRMNRRNGGYLGDWRLQDQRGTINSNTQTTLINKVREWFRPTYWLPMPGMTVGQTQEFAGLLAIFKGATGFTGASGDSNFVGLYFTTSTGAYTVDWGITTPSRPLGLTTSHASATSAYMQYNWNDVPASTETPEGYRQVLIRAYPQSGNFLSVIVSDTQTRFSSPSVSIASTNAVPWLSLKISAPNATQIKLGDSSPNIWMTRLEEVELVGRNNITSAANVVQFSNVPAVRAIKGTEFTATHPSCASMISIIPVITRIPLFDTRKINSNMTSFCFTSTNLEIVPEIHTDGVADTDRFSFNSAFGGTSIIISPRLNSNKASTTAGMYSQCTSLKRVDNIRGSTDMQSVARSAQQFYICQSLSKLPSTLNTPLLNDASLMFSSCRSLRTIPGMCFANLNLVTSMMENVSRCTVYPTDVIGSGLTATGITADRFAAFNNSGFVAPRLNWSRVNDASQAYRNSGFPEIVGGVMTAGWAPSFGGRGACMGWGVLSFAGGCKLKVLPKFEGMLQNTDVSGHIISPTDLDAFFTALGTTTAGRLSVSGNWGVTGGGRTPPGASFGIAIAKGWTFA